jgi:hypothetical protein
MTLARRDWGRLAIWAAAFAIVAAGAVRYIESPSFWLDEAFVAVSLRQPSLHTIFAPLEYGQYFPRLYLALIASLRKAFGYEIWALRLLPFLAFVAGTFLWARLLERRSRPFLAVGLLAAALFIGAGYWLDQSIQLKQYTLDVMLALIPFTVGDDLFEESFVRGRRKAALASLALPCFLSYTYPMALGARLLGWYLGEGRRIGWRVRASALAALTATALAGLISIWLTDHRFNAKDHAAYLAYWGDCILSARLQDGLSGTLRLIAKYFWGWHGRMPMVTAIMVPLQALGVYRIVRGWKNSNVASDAASHKSSSPESSSHESSWETRSAGSLILLGGVLLASLLVGYPVCAGRVVLFAQAHTQVLALEGALFIAAFWKRSIAARAFICLAVAVVAFHSTREFVKFITSEPAENIRPMISLMNPDTADKVWVHPCSVAQVRALPDALPVGNVAPLSEPALPPRGQKVWVLWTHLGDDHCRRSLDEVRARARTWQEVHQGTGRGLALAEF